jgi:hypothetical protein
MYSTSHRRSERRSTSFPRSRFAFLEIAKDGGDRRRPSPFRLQLSPLLLLLLHDQLTGAVWVAMAAGGGKGEGERAERIIAGRGG